jgi:glycosyltransferase involved in cell wall biosynthesis
MADCSISIIIPAYNVEKYLGAALDSIKAQEQLPDEVILIDDGSTDRTLEVAEAYRFPVPYQVASIENGGQGNARNVGVSLASSEYIYFFDSDDLLTTNFISSIKNQIDGNQHPDILLFSGESFQDNEYQGNRWVDYSRGFSGSYNDRVAFLNLAFSHKGLFCSPCLYVSKRSLWGLKGLAFGPNFLEDEAIFYPLLFSCRTFSVIDEVLFLRRNREGSTMTMAPNAKHVNGALHCMQTTLGLYSSADLISRERWHIRKRLEGHCTAYIVMARKAGLSIRLTELLSAISKTKSLKLAVKTFLFGVRADQSDAVRRIGRAVKKAGRLARR